MKFQCEKCSTGYTVPDEKVRGKRVRIQCKRCGHPIVLDGPAADGPTAQQPEPDSRERAAAQRSRQRTQMGGLTAPAVPPAAPAGVTAEDLWTVALSRDNPQKMTTSDLVAAVRSGRVTSKTLVWKKGMADWKPPFEVPVISMALRAAGLNPEPEAPSPAGSAARPQIAPPRSRTADSLPSLASLDDDGEETTVLDRDQARELVADELAHADRARLSSRAPPKPKKARTAPPVRAPSAQAGRSDAEPVPTVTAMDFDDEITEIVAPEDSLRYLQQSGVLAPQDASGDRISGFDDITRTATAEAAQELLRQSGGPSVDAGGSDEEPSVVVSAESRARSFAPAPSRPRYNPVQAQIQNEPTRIVRVRQKPKRNALWIGFLVVIAASAAGGFLASRYLAPNPLEAPPTP